MRHREVQTPVLMCPPWSTSSIQKHPFLQLNSLGIQTQVTESTSTPRLHTAANSVSMFNRDLSWRKQTFSGQSARFSKWKVSFSHLAPTLGFSFLSLFSDLGVLWDRRVWISFQSWSSFSVSSRASSRWACLSLWGKNNRHTPHIITIGLQPRGPMSAPRTRMVTTQSAPNVSTEKRGQEKLVF